jgi:hypothetical protein
MQEITPIIFAFAPGVAGWGLNSMVAVRVFVGISNTTKQRRRLSLHFGQHPIVMYVAWMTNATPLMIPCF